MKMLRVKLKNLNNLRRVSTELYVAPTSSEKNCEAVLKSQFYTAQDKLLVRVWTTILLNKEYPRKLQTTRVR